MQRLVRGERHLRGKAGTACDRCHTKKIKCDREPKKGRRTCTNCHDHRTKCLVDRDLKRSSNEARENQRWEGDLNRSLQRRQRTRGEDVERTPPAPSRSAAHPHPAVEHGNPTGAATPFERRPWSTPASRGRTHGADALRTSHPDHPHLGGGQSGPTVSYVCVNRRGSRARNRRSQVTLPSVDQVWQLLDSAKTRLDAVAPFVDWPRVQQEFQTCCERPRNVIPRLWIAFFFALLAVGSKLQPADPPNTRAERHYIKRALVHIDERNTTTDIIYCRTAFLLALAHIDLDDYRTARGWLKASISSARQLGLMQHSASDEILSAPLDEHGSDQRLWWLIYFYDRLVSLEYDDVVMTDDCPTPWQQREEDRPSSQYWTGLVEPFFTLSGLIPSVRLAQQVRQVEQNRQFQSGLITDNLASIDSELPSYKNACRISAQPATLKEPRLVGIGNYFPALTILQYRQLLGSGITTPAEREQVLLRCVDAALETAATIRVCTQQQTLDEFNALPAASIVPVMFRHHLWRCVLLLTFAHHFQEALACLHASCAVDWHSNHACINETVDLLQMIINRTLADRHTREHMWQDEELMGSVVTMLQTETWLKHPINLARNPWTILKRALEQSIGPDDLDLDDSSQDLSDAPDVLISPNHIDDPGRDPVDDDESEMPADQTMYDQSMAEQSMQQPVTHETTTILDNTMHDSFIHDETMQSQVFAEQPMHLPALQPPLRDPEHLQPPPQLSHHPTQNPPVFLSDPVPNPMLYPSFPTGSHPIPPPIQTSFHPGTDQPLHSHSQPQTPHRTPGAADLYTPAYLMEASLRPPMMPENPLVIGAEGRPFTPAHLSSPMHAFPTGHGLADAAAYPSIPPVLPGPHGFAHSPVQVNPVHEPGPPHGMAHSPAHNQYPPAGPYDQLQYQPVPPDPAHYDHLHDHFTAPHQPYLHDHYNTQPAAPYPLTQTPSYPDASAPVMHMQPQAQSFTSTDSMPSEAYIPRDFTGGSQDDAEDAVAVPGYDGVPAYYTPSHTQAPS